MPAEQIRIYSPSPEHPAACSRDERQGEPRRSSIERRRVRATAQFRFDTPQLAAGSFIMFVLVLFLLAIKLQHRIALDREPRGSFFIGLQHSTLLLAKSSLGSRQVNLVLTGGYYVLKYKLTNSFEFPMVIKYSSLPQLASVRKRHEDSDSSWGGLVDRPEKTTGVDNPPTGPLQKLSIETRAA